MVKYIIAPTSNDLYHHGILGQKWGKRNGPPYPLDSGSSKPTTDYAKRLKKEKKLPRNAISQNLNDWGKSAKTNVLYISGASGTGKSTVAQNLKDDNTEIINLDSYFDNIDGPHSKDFDKYLDSIKSDFRRILTPKNEIDVGEWGKVVERFENAIESYGDDAFKRNKKVIVEGVQLLDDTVRPDKKYFQDKPVVMLNTNIISSTIRANKRDEKKLSISDFSNRLAWNKDIKNFKKNNNLKHGIPYIITRSGGNQ